MSSGQFQGRVVFFLTFFFVNRLVYCCCCFFFVQAGEECIVRNSGAVGVCTILSACPIVEEAAKNGISPTICGFYGNNDIIVCCESMCDSIISFTK